MTTCRMVILTGQAGWCTLLIYITGYMVTLWVGFIRRNKDAKGRQLFDRIRLAASNFKL